MSKRLNIGVVANPDVVLAYESAMLETLLALPEIDCQLLTSPQTDISRENISTKLSNWGYRFYEKMDNTVLGIGDDPFLKQPLNASLAFNHPTETRRFDFIIALSSQVEFAKTQLKLTEFGVLYLDCINADGQSLSPPGYWDVMEFTTDSIIAVHLISPEGKCQKIYQSHSATTEVSPRQNRERIFWKAKSFIPKILAQLNYHSIEQSIQKLIDKQISDNEFTCLNPQLAENNYEQGNLEWNDASHTNGAMALQTAIAEITDSPVADSIKGIPKNITLIKHLFKKIPGFFRFYLQTKLNWDQWFLLFQFSAAPNTDISSFTPIYPPKDRIWADPHIFIKDGKNYVFIEEMILKDDKGFISVFEIHADGFYSTPVKILEEDFHLSYPQVFEWQNQIWMIPESSQNKTVSLYRCTEFPNQWEKHCDLLEGIDAVDTSILFDQDKCWLFCTVRPHPDASENDELHIYSSTQLVSSEWIAHPQNPVVSDVRRARPAGKIYRQYDRLIRPSQNCSKIYGYGFNLNAISVLSENDYQEEPITCINADQLKGIIGVHTYSRENELTVVDACRRYSKLSY